MSSHTAAGLRKVSQRTPPSVIHGGTNPIAAQPMWLAPSLRLGISMAMQLAAEQHDFVQLSTPWESNKGHDFVQLVSNLGSFSRARLRLRIPVEACPHGGARAESSRGAAQA